MTRLPTDTAAEVLQTVSEFTMVPGASIRFAMDQTISAIEQDLPGVIVECGVWKGGCSLAMLLAQRAVFGEVRRPVYLLDSFEGLPPARERDGPLAQAWQVDTTSPIYYDNCRANEDGVRQMLLDHGFTTAEFVMVRGWFSDTVPHLARELGDRGIALLRLDGDWYDSTTVCLESLLPLVPESGFVLIDDYYAWDGCARAVHDYLSRHDMPYRIRSLPEFVGAYLVKRAHRTSANEL